MMERAILIQQIYNGSDYADAISLTLGRTLEYCKRHDMDYSFTYGRVIENWDPKYGSWAKLPLIISALEQEYKYVIYLDADTVIVDMDTDFREGCPDFGIGLTLHKPNSPAFNVGALYVTNSPRVRAFMKEWVSWFPGPIFGWHEQAMLNLLMYVPQFNSLIVSIDPKWNSTREGGNHVDRAVVEGFHGEGDPACRVKRMKEFIDAHPA